MSISISPFLRNVLNADALFSQCRSADDDCRRPFIAPLTQLPSGLLIGAGLSLVPWVVMLAYVARKQTVSRLVMIDIIAINALWVAASFGLLVSGYIAPNTLGIAFVAAQAIAVAVLAELQVVGMRRATKLA